MLVSIITAMDRRGLIGAVGGLPWHLPNDLRRFRARTLGKPIIMGRRTFESIGKPLPGRYNLILTQNPDYSAVGCHVVRSFQDALSIAEDYLASTGGDEAMIIGGGKVYAEAMDYWDRLYVTLVEGEFKGGTYFPIRELLRQNWRPACAPETNPADAKNPHRHSFHVLERLRVATGRSSQGEEDRSPSSAEPETELDLAVILACENTQKQG